MRPSHASAAVCAAMFLSGAAALTFETLWFRSTRLAFGSSLWASSLVLAGFMAGLALGNALAVRHGARLRRPLRTYAGLEIAIAVAGVLLVLVLPRLGAWLAPVFRPLLDTPWLLNPLRLGLGFLLLLIPSTAMGLTLPVVVQALSERDPRFGAVLGRLYGWNTIGAVVGALAVEGVLIARLGILGSALAAAAADLLAAGCVLVVARAAGASPAPSSAAGASSAPGREPAAPPADARRRAWLCVWAAVGSGALLLALEVVWFRFLHLFVHGGSLAFAAMLSAVLAAIGLGGLAAGSFAHRLDRAERAAPVVALLAGVATVATYALFDRVLAPYGARYISGIRDVAWLAAALAFPTSFASGWLFTLTGLAVKRAVPRAVHAAGLLTLGNTAGAALGPLVAGFVLLPRLGIERSMFLLAAAYAVVALLLLGGTGRPMGARQIVPPAAAAVALLIALVAFPFGALRDDYLAVTIERATLGRPAEVVAVREGRLETLVYLRYDFLGQPMSWQLVTDGYNMAGDGFTARRYMKHFVYVPVALRPQPRSALLISFGTGSTARALVDTPSLQRIDVVDISSEILEMSDLVYSPQEHPLRDPRVHVHVEDGRYFLQTTGERWDLITAEPPPPKMSGVVSLYTREHFRRIHERLTDGGVASYWLAAQNLSEADTLAVVRAWCDVFEDCSLWQGFRLNWTLVGSRGGLPDGTAAAVSAQWDVPATRRELSVLGFEAPELLGATFLAGPERLRELSASTRPLTDNWPKRLSDHDDALGRGTDVLRAWTDVARTSREFTDSEWAGRHWPAELRDTTLSAFEFQRIVEELYHFPPLPRDPYRSMLDLHATLTTTDYRTLAQWQLGLGSDEAQVFRRLIAANPEDPRLSAPRGVLALADRDYEGAIQLFGRAYTATRDPRAWKFTVYSLCLDGQVERARQVLRSTGGEVPAAAQDPGFRRFLAETYGL